MRGIKHCVADVYVLKCYYFGGVSVWLPGCVLMSAGPLCAGMGGKKKKRMMYLTTKNAGNTAFSLLSLFSSSSLWLSGCPVSRVQTPFLVQNHLPI